MHLVHMLSMSAMPINSKTNSKSRVRIMNKFLKETMSTCSSLREPSRIQECTAKWEHIENMIDTLEETEAYESRQRKKGRFLGY